MLNGPQVGPLTCSLGRDFVFMLVRSDEVSLTDAATILGRHPVTIWRWCKRGFLAARKSGPHWIPKLEAVRVLRTKQRRLARLGAAR
jgi:hypothetical protein